MIIFTIHTFSPANDMPEVALKSGARLVIINQGETPFDSYCHLRFEEKIGEVLPPAVTKLKALMENPKSKLSLVKPNPFRN